MFFRGVSAEESGLRHGCSDEVKSEAGQHGSLTSVQNDPHVLRREVALQNEHLLAVQLIYSKLSTAFRWGTWNGLIVATIPIDLAADSSYWTGMTGMTSNWQNTRLSHAIYASFTPSANFRVRKSASICRISTWPREQVMCLPWGSNRMKDLEFAVPGTFWHLGHNLVLLQLQHGDCYWIFRKSGKFMLVVQLRGGSSDDLQDVRTVLYVILQHQPNMDLIAGNFLVGFASKMVDGETKGLKESRVFFKKTAICFKLHTCLHFILPESPVCTPINSHSMKSHSELREQRSVCHPCNHARTNVALNQELPCLL